jgi:CheY-like chemotaxis protein
MTNKILIVDDIEDNLFLLRMSLSSLDLEIISANSGANALEEINKNDFFCIILDIMMPQMDGVEVAQKLKDDSNTSAIPLLFITAINPDHPKALAAEKFGGVIRKPYDSDTLCEKVMSFKRV